MINSGRRIYDAAIVLSGINDLIVSKEIINHIQKINTGSRMI